MILGSSLAIVLAACGTSSHPASSASTTGKAVNVVAAENFWGNVTQQLGGSHVKVKSIISDPSADPHLYESDAADAEAIANAHLVIENGLGYDEFIDKLLSASEKSGRVVISAAKVLAVTGSTANPHLWYDLPRVPAVAQAIAGELEAIDPADKALFAANLSTFEGSLRPITDAIATIKAKYPHAPVAYTERVPGYLLAAAGLDVKTPPRFAQAIEDGNEPSPGDAQEMDTLMTDHGVKALLYNSQATSAVTAHVQDLARRATIPVVGITETLPAKEASYQSWQLHQVQALLAALGG